MIDNPGLAFLLRLFSELAFEYKGLEYFTSNLE